MRKICFVNFNRGYGIGTFFSRYPLIANRNEFEVTAIQQDADVIVGSSSPEFRTVPKPQGKKGSINIFVLGEIAPFRVEYLEKGIYDYAFTCFHIDHPRHFRLPHFFGRCNLNNLKFTDLIKKETTDYKKILEEKKDFCTFIFKNNVRLRGEFFHHLCEKYKKVNSAGVLFNNTGAFLPRNKDLVPSKLKYAATHKFTIAFENEPVPGYTSEKIVEPMFVNSIPIYRGNPLVEKDFNTKSFVNLNGFDTLNKMVEEVKRIDSSDELYLEMLKEPWLPNNTLHDYMKPEVVASWFNEALNCK